MPLTNAYNQVKGSVVQVLALNGTNAIVGSGSGSVIGTGAHVLTCEHCIVPGARMSIADPTTPGRALYGHTIYANTNLDIAILEFPTPVGIPVKFANSSTCSVGNGSFVVGFPMGIEEQTLLSAHIASITSNTLRIDASVNHGNSGGPLFNLNGEQIGVVNAKHGTLSQFLTQIKQAQPGASMSIGGIDPVQVIQVLIDEMQKNLNLGIGYAIPTECIKPLHSILNNAIP
jgi:serine protease Do